jgi:integrase
MLLTEVKIRKAKPKDKVYRLNDGNGLYFQIDPNGTKSWRFRYFFASKEKMISMGIYDDVSLGEARDKAAKARKQVENNIDPSAQKQEDRRVAIFSAENSFEVVAKEWHELNKSKWSEGTSKDIWERITNHLLPAIGHRPFADITSLELLEAIRKVENKGRTETSHRLLQYATKIFRFGILTKRGKYNPAFDLKDALKPHKSKRYPTILLSEVPLLLEKLETAKTSRQNKIAVRLLLLTFMRTIELRKSYKSYVNFEKAEWRLPPELTKMKEVHIVPLSKQAIALLEELNTLTGNTPLLFPPQQKRKHQFMSENTINQLLKRMGYKGKLVGHGFRALASTSLNEAGLDDDVIERQLDHRERDSVRAAYNHAQYLSQRRELMQTWADMLDAEVKKYNEEKKEKAR